MSEHLDTDAERKFIDYQVRTERPEPRTAIYVRWESALDEVDRLHAEAGELRERVAELEQGCIKAITERDRAEDRANGWQDAAGQFKAQSEKARERVAEQTEQLVEAVRCCERGKRRVETLTEAIDAVHPAGVSPAHELGDLPELCAVCAALSTGEDTDA